MNRSFSPRYPLNYRSLSWGLVSLMSGLLLSATDQAGALAQDLDQLCTRFPDNSQCVDYQPKPWEWDPTDQQQLDQGEAIVAHDHDQFRGQVWIEATPDQVWDVLTDYEALSDFLPGLISNTVLSQEATDQGKSVIMESVNVTDVLVFQISSRTLLELQEQPQTQIDFSLIEGDHLQELSGSWQLDSGILPSSIDPEQTTGILLTYQAQASSRGVATTTFTGVFVKQIRQNLQAIKAEIGRRQET